ncbi:DNA fragmentation factor subunit beta [Cephus cinctus]|uniref:DNAation factor subunit beta n=1 Tax=Cephus cinctus TaxID=211228 RepID=A0AAJ7CDL1_CEPCN|nr:DNA fragmentation factor subunit beta [Cephus cinctus]
MSLFSECFRKIVRGNKECELKGYKVTDVNRRRKFGVACRTLEELKRKACAKLNITNNLADIRVYLLDGSELDEEYFSTLQSQTTLILRKPGEPLLSDADILYEALRRVNVDFLKVGDEVSKFLKENLRDKVALLNSILKKADSRSTLSTKDEDPDWFRELETNAATKEAYLYRRCQDRIRGYLYKTIDQIKSSEPYINDSIAKQNLHHMITFFKMQLKEDNYFGFYFDRRYARPFTLPSEEAALLRSQFDICNRREKIARLDKEAEEDRFRIDKTDEISEDEIDAKRSRDVTPLENFDDRCPYEVSPSGGREQVALCDSRGEFKCDGRWNLESCSYENKHKINPYNSREELILFSTWNLDHKIERSRTIIPSLLKISEKDTLNKNEVMEFYENLFTVKNLRLVHIVCHDKTTHK